MSDPMQPVEAEQAVLGSAMLEPSVADQCLPMLPPTAFGRVAHEAIWSAIGHLRAAGKPCDALAVADKLQAAGKLDIIGGIPYLTDLVSSVPATASATHYAGIVHHAHLRRQVVRAAREAMASAQDPALDAAAIAAAVEDSLRRITDAAASTDAPVPLSSLVLPAFEFVERLYEGTTEPGIPTGVPTLDRELNGGLHRGELVVLGAAPSQGKSALAEAMALYMASQARTVDYATPEMTAMTVALRALAHRAGVDLRRLYGAPKLDEHDWSALTEALGGLSEQGQRMYVDHTSTSWDGIAAHARALHARDPLTLLVIDHLHELEWPKGADTENRAISEIVAGCKRLAKTLNIAVLLLSQLNRNARQQDREPALHDLRGSGAIEQHADVALLLHPKDAASGLREVSLDVIIAKNRNGRTGPIRLLHDRATGRFRTRDDYHEDQAAGGVA